MPKQPDLFVENEFFSTSKINAWLTLLWRMASSAALTVKEGSPLTLRQTSTGTELGLSLPEYTYGVTTGTVSARSGVTPGSGMVQPYLFNGTKFVAVGQPLKVFNKSKQTIASGYSVSWNYLQGFPFFDWSDCTSG